MADRPENQTENQVKTANDGGRSPILNDAKRRKILALLANGSSRGVAAGVDLVESLAAKTALEEAGVQACDAVIRQKAREMKKK